MITKLHSKLLFPLFLCLGLLLLMVGISKVGATASVNTLLFSESFDYPDGTVIDHVVTGVWQGRYEPPDVSATVQAGQAHLNRWRSLTTVETFLNQRDSYTHLSLTLIGESGFAYKMEVGAAYGLSVAYDGYQRVEVRSDNLGAQGRRKSHVFEVSSYFGQVQVDLYLKDQESQVFITDDLGVQATPLWQNEDIFGNIRYRLGLGYGGTYDNITISYTDGPLPTADAPRAPVLVTSALVEGIINQPYILLQEDWMMEQGIFFLQQIRADGGALPLAYTISEGSLPTGISFSTVYTNPSDDGSPMQWLAVFKGTPTITGTFPITVQVSDASNQTDVATYTLTILPPEPPTIDFAEHFTDTDGEMVHDVPGSQWRGRYGANSVSAVYQNHRAQMGRWGTLTALEAFRNAESRYLHARVRVFGGAGNDLDGGTLQLTCGGAFGVIASYDGGSQVSVKSNNLGYAPQMYTNTFTVTAGLAGEIGLDIYIKGADTRVYVTDANGIQATDMRHNWRLEGACENGDYTLTLGYAGLYDDVIVEDLPEIPESVNPVRIVEQGLLNAVEGVPYHDELTAISGKPPYTWTLASPPPGLILSSDGILSGVPTAPGDYELFFSVTDDIGQVATWASSLTVEADAEGNLLFADRFSLPNDLLLVERDGTHWESLPHTPYALRYLDGWMEILGHKQGALKPTFANDGVTPLQVTVRMDKGRMQVAQANTCWGMQMEYDGIQHIAVRWNDLCWQPYMKQQDFLLKTFHEIITVTIEIKGQEFALQVEDSQQRYQRGPFELWRVRVGKPISIHFRDNTPYGVGRYTSYQAGPSHFDDLMVRRGLWTISEPTRLRQTEELGRLLFFDPILSGDNRRACASCHQPDKGFADGLRYEMGMNGQLLARNSPGIANMALMGAHFWDGREPLLDQVALHPIQNGAEMGQSLPDLLTELEAIPHYQQSFQALWAADGVTGEHIGEALAAYMRTLMELRTGYDWNLYRQGTLTQDEDAGLILFEGKAGCTQCHTLVPVTQVGDIAYSTPVYKVLGVPRDAAGTQLDGDIGREAITGEAQDRHAFRVPNLRNLTRTAPYMHNGVFETLEEVVEFYNVGGGTGLGLTVPNQASELKPLNLSATEKQQLVAFLKALSPQYPNYVAIPDSVPSGLPVGGSDPILTPTKAGISGRVTATASPLPSILVDAYKLGFNDTWSPAGSTYTNETGHYTITDLISGTYRLYFLDPRGTHIEQYYNNANNFSNATNISVLTGTITPNIDASLAQPVPPAAELSGNIATWNDPQTGEITISAWDGSQFTISRQITCPDGATPSNVTLNIGADSLPMSESLAGSGEYHVTWRVPDDLSEAGEQSIQINWTCATRSALSNLQIGQIFVQLNEPLGKITDAKTGLPIAGAAVTLYHIAHWRPQTNRDDLQSNTCESNNSRLPSLPWNQPVPEGQESVRIAPKALNASDLLTPTINPLITGQDGQFAWQLAEGCWYVVVQAEGYESQTSPVIGVLDNAAAVKDLNLALQPVENNPLAIQLATFSATASDEHILIEWQTISEIDNLGFNLYRAESPLSIPNFGSSAGEEEMIQLNRELIPSQAPNSAQGASYTFIDNQVQTGITYYYWIEEMKINGQTNLHRPISVTFTPQETSAISINQISLPQRGSPVAWLLLLVLSGLIIRLSLRRGFQG